MGTIGTYWGDSLSAASDYYLRSSAQRAQEDRQKTQEELDRLRLQQLESQVKAQDSLAGNLEQLANLEPEQIEYAPGTPGTPPTIAPNVAAPVEERQFTGDPVQGPPAPMQQMDESTGEPVTTPMGEALAPSEDAPTTTPPTPVQPVQIAPGTPGTPAVTGRAHTMRSIIKGLGADRTAQLLQTKEGGEAIKALGPLSDAEIERRRKTALGSQEAKTLRQEADQLISSGGDPVTAYLKQAGALEREAEASDDDQRRQTLLTRAQAMRDKAVTLQADPRERALVTKDLARVYPAMAAYKKNPTSANLMSALEAYQGVESKTVQAQAVQFLRTIETGTKLRNESADEFWKAVANRTSEQAKTGPMNVSRAIEEVAKENPDLLQQALPDLVNSKSPAVLRALGMEGLTGKMMDAAYALTVRQRGADGEVLKEGSEEFMEAYQANLEMLSTSSRAGQAAENEARIAGADKRNADRIGGANQRNQDRINKPTAGGTGGAARSPEERARQLLMTGIKGATSEINALTGSLGAFQPNDTSARAQQLRRDLASARDRRRKMIEQLKESGGPDMTNSEALRTQQRQERGDELFRKYATDQGATKGGKLTQKQVADIEARVQQQLKVEGF